MKGFPNVLYISDPAAGYLYAVEESIPKPLVRTTKEVRSILVAQNQVDIYTVNRDDNTITRINRGVSLGDIRVGKVPYGICEDPNGIIYVTNYEDNTVTIIRNNMPEPVPILVDKGPRGIVSDGNGTIWVACFLSGTVVKIVNNVVVDRIQVAYNPEGITCDIQNNIWVTCSGSNCVVKIAKSKKVLTVETGKRPMAVVADKNLNVYVANFEDDTVTVINPKGNSSATTTTVGVGDGPSAIAIDGANYVYVASNLSGEDVYKIHPKTKEVIERIHVCTSPAAFGDFTGCAAYNVFNPYGTSPDNGVARNAANYLKALEPTFKVIAFQETSSKYIFTVDSDLLNLNNFETLTLNGIGPTKEAGLMDIVTNWKFIIPREGTDLPSQIELVGYFPTTETGETLSPIKFKPMNMRNLFSVKVGMVDRSYNNWKLMYEKVIDFNTHDIVASVVNTSTYDKGHIVCLVPNRIYTISKDYLTVNSGYAFGNGWLPDLDTQRDELNKIMASGITQEDIDNRTILFNPDETEAASLFFFHFYRIEANILSE